LLVVMSAGLHAREQETGEREAAAMKARPFDLQHVRLLDGPLKDATLRSRRYLLDLDADRLLHMFRLTAALPSSAKPLGGWERPASEVRGHFVGHYLSACAMMHAATGDEKLIRKVEAMVSELAKCQQALGGGYLSAFPESFFDRLESGQRVHAPWYTIHKILAGLCDVHVHCDSRQALAVAEALADWVKKRTDRLNDEQMTRVLHVEFGGMAEALYNLYALTGNPHHIALADRFDHPRILDPLAEQRDELTGLHGNTTIPKVIGAARRYELTGNPRDRTIAEFFWHQVTSTRCYCTGGTTNQEHWRRGPNRLAGELGPHTQESCCTYNMLKLTRHLFAWTADVRAADYYERALFNGILPTQSPADGTLMYFVPLGAGYWKMFSLPTDSFWCCTGTGIESFAKLGEGIYFHDDDTLYVNLFVASELHWPDKGLRLRQETRFPKEQSTTLTFRTDRPVDVALEVRIPYWATQGAAVRINGKRQELEPHASTYAALKRKWATGDQVEVDLPMRLHAQPMPDDANLMAFLYGPLVLAGDLGNEGLTREMVYGHAPHEHRLAGEPGPAPYFLTDDDDLNTWIRPVAGKPLTFRTTGQSQETTFVPLHHLFGRRYGVYWHVYPRDGEAHKARLARDAAVESRRARTIDRVAIGDSTSEADHHLQGDRTQSGAYLDGRWRHALPGGWFSYTMKVLPDQPMTLLCTYWGDDAGPRTFNVLIDGAPIATQTLHHNQPDKFFDVSYTIPPGLTREKQHVTVRFQGRPDSVAGGVYACVMLRPR